MASELNETLSRAADFLEQYAAFIHRVKPEEIEEHPYLPELEQIAADVRALSSPNNHTSSPTGGGAAITVAALAKAADRKAGPIMRALNVFGGDVTLNRPLDLALIGAALSNAGCRLASGPSPSNGPCIAAEYGGVYLRRNTPEGERNFALACDGLEIGADLHEYAQLVSDVTGIPLAVGPMPPSDGQESGGGKLTRDDIQFLIDLAAVDSLSAFARRNVVRIARAAAASVGQAAPDGEGGKEHG